MPCVGFKPMLISRFGNKGVRRSIPWADLVVQTGYLKKISTGILEHAESNRLRRLVSSEFGRKLTSVHASQILFEDNHLLVLNKPADWIVQGASTDQRSLLESARMYVKKKYNKPGNVYLGVVSRLDAPVTGAVPFARTSKSAARLNEQFRQNSVQKEYLAIVSGTPSAIEGRLVHNLLRRTRETVTRVCSEDHPEGQQAILEYRVTGCNRFGSWLTIRLITGRKHQIRCQLASIGCPILGDRIYGSQDGFPQGIALHCHRLEFDHPTTKDRVKIQADTPIYWPSQHTGC